MNKQIDHSGNRSEPFSPPCRVRRLEWYTGHRYAALRLVKRCSMALSRTGRSSPGRSIRYVSGQSELRADRAEINRLYAALVAYGAFIVPGLIMLSLFTESISNASFGIYLPKFTGTIYELLSAPVSSLEIVLAYVGAAATKSIILGLIILATAALFVPIQILHPVSMIAFLVLTATTFSLFGFIIGIWAKGFEQLQFIPRLIVAPLTFLGGAFYSIDMLPPAWRTVTLFNPMVYLISAFRWSFYEASDVGVGVSLAMTLGFFVICLAAVGWIFRTGYRLKS